MRGRVVANGACLTAIHADEGQIDPMTSLAGFSWVDLASDATPFRVAGVEVRVGQLEKLLLSKERTSRGSRIPSGFRGAGIDRGRGLTQTRLRPIPSQG